MKKKQGAVLCAVPLLGETIISSCPVKKNKAAEVESMSFVQGPMHRVSNCKNERSGVIES